MTIYLRDPRAEMWSDFGRGLFQGWQQGKEKKEVDKGLSKMDEIKQRNQSAGLLGQAMNQEQDWFNTNNNYLGLKKDYEILNTKGLSPEELARQQQEIVAKSHALREQAKQRGITLYGEDLDANGMRLAMDADSRTRMAGLGSQFANAGYANAAQFMPQSDLGRDAGASQPPPAFNFSNSMAGLGGLLNQTLDPTTQRNEVNTAFARMHLSPGAMEKLNPVIADYLDAHKEAQFNKYYAEYQSATDPNARVRAVLNMHLTDSKRLPWEAVRVMASNQDVAFDNGAEQTVYRKDGFGNYSIGADGNPQPLLTIKNEMSPFQQESLDQRMYEHDNVSADTKYQIANRPSVYRGGSGDSGGRGSGLSKAEKWAEAYELTQLIKDDEIIREYEAAAESGFVSPQLQKAANEAAERRNQYWNISSGGSYSRGQTQGGQSVALAGEEYNERYRLLRKEWNMNDQEARQYLAENYN